MPTGPRAIRPQASVWFGDRVPGSARRRRTAAESATTRGAVAPDDAPGRAPAVPDDDAAGTPPSPGRAPATRPAPA